MKKIALGSTSLVLVVVLVWLVFFWRPPVKARLADPPAGGDFTLDSWRGPLSTVGLRGKVVLIHFGYTWCPDICPTNLAFIAGALRELAPEERSRVQALFVSVDPQRDTLERLREYTSYFHRDILGVTGTPTEVAAVGRLYGAAHSRSAQPASAMGYVVDHTAYTYVLDQTGSLVRTLDHGTPPNRIRTVIREALRGGKPASTRNHSISTD